MLEFLVDNIFVVFAGKVFQQAVGIPMGTNCAPLLANIFLYSCEANFIQSLSLLSRCFLDFFCRFRDFCHRTESDLFLFLLLSTGKKHRKRFASQFNFTYRYIDDVLSINNPDFENYLCLMYPPELEIKDTT